MVLQRSAAGTRANGFSIGKGWKVTLSDRGAQGAQTAARHSITWPGQPTVLSGEARELASLFGLQGASLANVGQREPGSVSLLTFNPALTCPPDARRGSDAPLLARCHRAKSRQRVSMAKKGNAGSSKAAAAAKRSSAKVQNERATKTSEREPTHGGGQMGTDRGNRFYFGTPAPGVPLELPRRRARSGRIRYRGVGISWQLR